MLTIFFEPMIQILVYVVILMIGTLVAIYVLGLLRANSLQQEQDINKELNYFRELNDKGDLSDVEFRTIKEKYAEEIKDKINIDENTKSKSILNYKDALSWLLGANMSESMQDTQVVGCSGCNNKNGLAEYIEMETKRLKEHVEDHGIDWKANQSNDDNTESNINNHE
ncbi:MAG: hypothetical protein LBH59_09320 [Planctomycetaceae bacterium]|jgi:Na+-transporting NADH:ubiquinone oxidoreductase subunit NqrC|nr:hypothetical protein [Planctomycetaceae bacterium]